MNPQRHTLSESLRELAANSPQASPELGVRLRQAFARHHAQRRLRKRAVFAVSLAACLAIAVAWLRTGKQTQDVRKPGPPAQVAKAPVPQPEIVAPKIERPSMSLIATAPVRAALQSPALVKTSTIIGFVSCQLAEKFSPFVEAHYRGMLFPMCQLAFVGSPERWQE